MKAARWAALGAFVIAGGCGGDEPIAPQLSAIQTRVFAPSCTFSICHRGATPAGGLDLSDATKSLAQLVAQPTAKKGVSLLRVRAGQPEQSSLVKVVDVPAADNAYQGIPRMPIGATLSADAIAAIRAWITAGAKGD